MALILVMDKNAPILQTCTPEQVSDDLHFKIMNGSANVATYLQDNQYKGIRCISPYLLCSGLNSGKYSNTEHYFLELSCDNAGFWVKGTPYICKVSLV